MLAPATTCLLSLIVILSLAGPARAVTLMINELMASNGGSVRDPSGDSDDWIEIYNYGSDAVDIGGMCLTDDLDSPTAWRIADDEPDETTIPAKGYLLIWADNETNEGTLHANFRLGAGGEQIALFAADGRTLIDSVTFGLQTADRSYGRLPDGTDNWQVMETPTPAASNGGGASAVVINEIMYHPYHPVPGAEDVRQEYIELLNQGTASVNLTGWRLSNGVDFVCPDVMLRAGEYLVVAADVAVFKSKYPSVTNVVGGWTGKLSNSGETIELVDDSGVRIDQVRYADEGDWAVRELGPDDHGHRGWLWSNEHDGGGKSLELISAALPGKYGQNWAASKTSEGTPGAANSWIEDDIAPLILDALHWPILPVSGDAVTVSARIVDELKTSPAVALHHRRDGEAGFSTVTMFDDGQHGDAKADDGVYGAAIPARPVGTVVEFYIEATDAAGHSRTWPAPSMADGTPQQVTNALYLVTDSALPAAGWAPGSQPIYHLIMKAQELTELQQIADRNYQGNLFTSEAMSDAQMNATFISVDGVNTDVRYSVGVRNRGNRKRADPPMCYHVNFRHDDSWKGVAALNLNSKYPHIELLGSVLSQMAGLPAANAVVVQLRANGQNLAASDYNRTYGSYTAVEVLDDDWARNHFPDDSNGNIYRCTYYEDGVHPRTLADLAHKEPAGRPPNPDDYRKNYIKQTNGADDDWSDLFDLIARLNNENISDNEFVAQVSRAAHLEKWMRFLAFDAIVGNREGGLNSGQGDDYAMYRGVEDPRFWLVAHDLDTLLGQGDHDYQPQRDIFTYTGVKGLSRLFRHPDVLRLYYQQHKDLIETVFAPENIYPLIDRLLGEWVPGSEIEGPQGIKQFVRDRANSILHGGYPSAGSAPQIPQQFTINSGLPVVSGFHQTTIPITTLSGTANAITTRSVSVNGQLVKDWSQRNGTWSSGNIILYPGINRVIVQAFDGPDGTGGEVDEGYIDLWYDTGSTNNYPSSSDVGLFAAEPGPAVRLLVRDSYLPDIPVLVRVEVINGEGLVDRTAWDAVATLSVTGNPDVRLSANQVTLYNGLGSAMVTFSGSGDFTLTAEVNGIQAGAALTDWSDRPTRTVSGRLTRSETWSGIIHVTGGDFTIANGVVLTLNPGTMVLIDGVASGTNGTDIDVEGAIASLGTAASPVTITAYTPGRNWGELHFVDAEPSTFQYTNISGGGHSPRVGHSNSGPTIRASNSTLVFENASLTDNAGKLMDASGCDLTFRHCLFARSVMGPEIAGTALLFEDGWITEMTGTDDGDGIYIHGQRAGQLCTLSRSVAANIYDDGIDTLSSEVTMQDFIVRDCRDKGVSIYGGEVNINHCLIVENNKAPEDPTVATIANKTFNGGTAIVNIDRTTIVTSKVPGYRDIGIQSHNKYGVASGVIICNVTNSIIDATDPLDAQAPYLASDIHVSYSNVFGEPWPGTGNLNAAPLFVDPANHDYRLQAASPCIDAGDPAAGPDADQSVTDQGYWSSAGGASTDPPDDNLTKDTIWTPHEGPYRVTGEMTIPAGTTLTILPGTTVFFDPDAKLVIRGRLVAEGADHELIRFTRVPAGATWAGLQFINTMDDNRITYAVIEYGRTHSGMIGVNKSNLLLEDVTFDNTLFERIRTIDSSLVVRRCIFADMCAPGEAPTDNQSEHISGRGVPKDGWLIVENNLFGKTPGHNDAIDLDGPSRPNPILQIIDNVFTGGGDDALDLEGDAHIEGNLFMNYTKDQYNKASGESNGISAGAGKHYVMIRNVFHNIQHVAQVKNESFLTFVNNTVSGVSGAAIYFDLDLPGRRPGRGAYVEGNIFWDVPLAFEGIVETTDIAVNYSDIASEWHVLGVGNIDADPLFVDQSGNSAQTSSGLTDPNGDFHLKSDSPAVGAGPWGLDMGAYVPAGAAISGEPDSITYHTNATLTVGGPGITHYKYCLNDAGGPWSAERPVETPITLTNLLNGRSYVVYVIGKNSAGVWQSEDSPTVSRTWTVDTSHSKLVLNEVLAINNSAVEHEGTFPDMVELYYDGPAALSLSGISITDAPQDPARFVFPTGTAIQPGGYLVLYADSNAATSGIHLGFGLEGDGEGLYLYDSAGVLLDSVEFGLQIPDLSIGRLARRSSGGTGSDGQWRLTVPTFGQTNIAVPLGDPSTLRINEWLADGLVLFEDDFIELLNPHPSPVDAGRLYLTDNPVTQPNKYPLGPLSFIAGQGFAAFRADNQSRPGHVDFRLSADGEIIALLDAEGKEIDKVFYGPQTTDVSQGRAPDGMEHLEFFTLPTPGVANPSSGSDTVQVTTLVPEHADKRVLVPTGNIGVAWTAESRYDDSSWLPCTGRPGGVGFERNSGYESYLSIDLGTQMYNINTTCYIRIPFGMDADNLSRLSALSLKVRYDDGFVAYLNGMEIARRNFTGTPAWNSRSSASHVDSAAIVLEPIDVSPFIGYLKRGSNILALHGMNDSLTSSDMLISVELEGTLTTPAAESPFAGAMELLSALRVTELMYHATAGSSFDYIELKNIGQTTLNLTGVRLSGGIDFTFGALTLPAGQYVLVVDNAAAFGAAYGANLPVAGEYAGSLSNGGEKIVLQLPVPLDAAILRFEYSDTWYPATDGGGEALVIADPLAHPAAWAWPESWRPAAPSPGTNDL